VDLSYRQPHELIAPDSRIVTDSAAILRLRNRGETQKGMTLFELFITFIIIGAALLPSYYVVTRTMVTIRAEQNETILETARESLIRYAARNDGCLPFAADWEGSLPNTDQNGAIGYTDTGVSKANTRAGDLPWTDLGLGDNFLDGQGLRIQYHVASQYADFGSDCLASAKGEEWNQLVTYQGTVADPTYVYYTAAGGTRGLYEIDGALPAGTNPDIGGFTEVGVSLPSNLLELRRGPNIKATGSQQDVLSAQNIFVLIATGDNINTLNSINMPYMRDKNHRASGAGQPWNLNQSNIDDVRFSATHEYNSTDEGASGDDMLLVMSFLSFKSALRSFGMKLESKY